MNGINWAALQNFNRGNNGPQLPQPQLPVLSVVFVDGRKGVDEYPIPPNCQGIPLFDRETGALFIKSSDAYSNATVVEYEPPVPKKTEADIQKAMLVSMDERMNRLETAINSLINGGVQNGGQSNSSSTEQTGSTTAPAG